jgi:hypothetical protein
MKTGAQALRILCTNTDKQQARGVGAWEALNPDSNNTTGHDWTSVCKVHHLSSSLSMARSFSVIRTRATPYYNCCCIQEVAGKRSGSWAVLPAVPCRHATRCDNAAAICQHCWQGSGSPASHPPVSQWGQHRGHHANDVMSHASIVGKDVDHQATTRLYYNEGDIELIIHIIAILFREQWPAPAW